MYHLHVSAYITDRLKKNKMTYRDLSEKSGVPLSTLYGYARGQVAHPDDSTLSRLADALGDDGNDVLMQLRDASQPPMEHQQSRALADDQWLDRIITAVREQSASYSSRLYAIQNQYDRAIAYLKDLARSRLIIVSVLAVVLFISVCCNFYCAYRTFNKIEQYEFYYHNISDGGNL